MSTDPTIRFSRRSDGAYNVRFTGRMGTEVLGKVWRNRWGVWVTEHRDGTPGPGAWSRIDAAWAMVNA